MKRRVSLQTRALVAVGTFVAGTSAVTLIVLHLALGREATRAAERERERAVHILQADIDARLETLEQALVAIADAYDFRNSFRSSSKDDVVTYESLAARVTDYVDVLRAPLLVITDDQGRVRVSTGRPFVYRHDLSHHPLVAEALAGRSAQGVWRMGADVYLVAAHRLPTGCVLAGTPLGGQLSPGLRSMLGWDAALSWNGKLLAVTGKPPGALARALTHPEGAAPAQEVLRAELRGRGSGRLELGSTRYVTFRAGVGGSELLQLTVLVPEKQLFGAHRRMQRLLLIVALAVLGAAVAGSRFFVLGITRPIARMAAAATVAARGDLSRLPEALARRGGSPNTRADEPGDEIEELGTSLRRLHEYLTEMAVCASRIADGDLSATIEPRSDKDDFGRAFAKMVANVRAMVKGIHASSQTLRDSVGQITVSSARISRGAATESNATEATSALLARMTTQAQQLSDRTRAIAAGARDTAGALDRMAGLVERTGHGSELLNEAVDRTVEAMSRTKTALSDLSNRFAEVNETTRRAYVDAQDHQRVLQTTIAALGDRAGEIAKSAEALHHEAVDDGRGARAEIARNARAIALALERLRGDAQKAAVTVRSAGERIVEGVAGSARLASEVHHLARDQVLGAQKVHQVVHHIRQVARRVAMVAEEQLELSREILKAVADVRNWMEDAAKEAATQRSNCQTTVRSMESIALVSRENLEVVEQLSAAAHSLALEAQRLRTQVEAFRM